MFPYSFIEGWEERIGSDEYLLGMALQPIMDKTKMMETGEY
jgi:hypothetical protein